jgi:hypothetical protein
MTAPAREGISAVRHRPSRSIRLIRLVPDHVTVVRADQVVMNVDQA